MRTITVARSVALGVALALVLSFCTRGGEGGGNLETRRDLEIRLQLPKSRFTAGESLMLTVLLRNAGASAVRVPDPYDNRNWQPVYTLQGPGEEDPRVFSFRSVATGESAEPTGVEPALVELPAGGTLERTLPLDRWLRLAEPGSYSLGCRLDWGELSVASEEVSFELESSRAALASLAIDVGAPNAQALRVVFLRHSDAETTLWESTFSQSGPDAQVLEAGTARRVTELEGGLDEVFAAWTNFDRMEGLHHWQGWRRGHSFFALSSLRSEPSRLELAGSDLLHPALMVESGDLDLFFITEAGRRLDHTRFPAPPLEGSGEGPKLLWSAEAPGRILAGRLALAPRARGDERHGVLVLEGEGGGLAVQPLVAGAEGPEYRQEAVELPGAFALPGSEPALRVDAEGRAHAALLVARDLELRQLSLVTLRFGGEEGEDPAPAWSRLPGLPEAPEASAVAYAVDGSGKGPIWALLTREGLRTSLAPGRANALEAPPALPLQLLHTGAWQFLLVLEDSGPALMSLP